MATAVRCFAYSGMIALPVASSGGARVENAMWTLKQPYLASETLSASSSAVSTSAALSTNEYARMIRVEVEQGKRIRYELSNNQSVRTATTDSPVLYGEETLEFGPGWTLSVIEDA